MLLNLLLAASAFACGALEAPALSVAPSSGPGDREVPVEISGGFFDLRVSLDYQDPASSSVASQLSASLDGVPLLRLRWLDAGHVEAFVPAHLPLGPHTLFVTDARGTRQRAQAYSVTAASCAGSMSPGRTGTDVSRGGASAPAGAIGSPPDPPGAPAPGRGPVDPPDPPGAPLTRVKPSTCGEIPTATIAFTVFYDRRPEAGAIDGTVWRLAGDGTEEQPLTAGEVPRLSPDGTSLLFRRGAANHYKAALFVRDLSSSRERSLYQPRSDTVTVDWTPDARRLVFDLDCDIEMMTATATGAQTLVAGSADGCTDDAPAVSPSDGRIAFHNKMKGIAVADPDGANVHWLENSALGDKFPRWSPDGRWLAVQRRSSYVLLDPSGAVTRSLTSSTALAGAISGPGAWTPDGEAVVAPASCAGTIGLYAIPIDERAGLVRLPSTSALPPIESVGSVHR